MSTWLQLEVFNDCFVIQYTLTLKVLLSYKSGHLQRIKPTWTLDRMWAYARRLCADASRTMRSKLRTSSPAPRAELGRTTQITFTNQTRNLQYVRAYICDCVHTDVGIQCCRRRFRAASMLPWEMSEASPYLVREEAPTDPVMPHR